MLPIAALIVADTTGRTFAGMDLNERAALVASDAGIHHCYFMGSRLPDLSAMKRLRDRGSFTMGLLGWPRVFAGVPNAEVIVVIDARTIVDADLLRATVREAIAHGGRAALLVDQGPRRKDSLIQVRGRPRHIGDGRRQRHELRRPGPAAIAGRPRANGPQPARCGASPGEGGPARRGADRRSILPRARQTRRCRGDRARIRARAAEVDAARAMAARVASVGRVDVAGAVRSRARRC